MFKRKEAHTGENLYEAFAKILNEFKLQNKILAVTLDNSSNNKSLMEYLDKDESNSFSLLNHVRCFAHVLNLAAQVALSVISKELEQLRLGITKIKSSPQLENKFEEIQLGFLGGLGKTLKPQRDVKTRWELQKSNLVPS